MKGTHALMAGRRPRGTDGRAPGIVSAILGALSLSSAATVMSWVVADRSGASVLGIVAVMFSALALGGGGDRDAPVRTGSAWRTVGAVLAACGLVLALAAFVVWLAVRPD